MLAPLHLFISNCYSIEINDLNIFVFAVSLQLLGLFHCGGHKEMHASLEDGREIAELESVNRLV